MSIGTCWSRWEDESDAAATAAAAGLAVAGGAGLGALIDWLHRDRYLVYSGPPTAAVRAEPIVTKKAQGLRVLRRF